MYHLKIWVLLELGDRGFHYAEGEDVDQHLHSIYDKGFHPGADLAYKHCSHVS